MEEAREGSNAPIPRTCWQLFEPSVGWNVWEKRCVTRGVLLAEVAPSWPPLAHRPGVGRAVPEAFQRFSPA